MLDFCTVSDGGLMSKEVSVIVGSAASETVQQTLTYRPTIESFESCTGKKGFLLKAGR